MGSSTVEGKKSLLCSFFLFNFSLPQASSVLHMVMCRLPRARGASWWWRLPPARPPTPPPRRRSQGWRRASSRRRRRPSTVRSSSARVFLLGAVRGTEMLYSLVTQGWKISNDQGQRLGLGNYSIIYFNVHFCFFRLMTLFRSPSLILITNRQHLLVEELQR